MSVTFVLSHAGETRALRPVMQQTEDTAETLTCQDPHALPAHVPNATQNILNAILKGLMPR